MPQCCLTVYFILLGNSKQGLIDCRVRWKFISKLKMIKNALNKGKRRCPNKLHCISIPLHPDDVIPHPSLQDIISTPQLIIAELLKPPQFIVSGPFSTSEFSFHLQCTLHIQRSINIAQFKCMAFPSSYKFLYGVSNFILDIGGSNGLNVLPLKVHLVPYLELIFISRGSLPKRKYRCSNLHFFFFKDIKGINKLQNISAGDLVI